MRAFLVFGSIALAGAAASAVARSGTAPLDLRAHRIVDLTHPFDEKTLYWPTSPSRFELKTLHRGPTGAGFFYSSYALCTPEHGGTHLDAPVHFAEGRQSADQIPLDRLIGPAVVIDVRAQAVADADYRLSVADVKAWESRHGAVPPESIVLLRTGWSARWPDAKRYLGDDTPGEASRLHFPGYGAEATRLLVLGARAAVLGIDTASLDHGPSRDFVVHRIANGANVPGLENLTNLGELPETGATVVALPMKIAGGSGGPLRAVAILPR
jgi:kynurenine formamidase